jgi:hypothetical protein
MIRKLVAKLNNSLSEKLVSARRRHNIPLRVWFAPEINTDRHRQAAMNSFMIGETADLSRTGIAFLVSSIRINENYLVGHDRKLILEIALPNGTVHVRVVGRRYEKVGEHLSTERFLVGAHIVGFEGNSETVFRQFLKHGSRTRRATGSLELGID